MLSKPEILTTILDLFFPKSCLGCGTNLVDGKSPLCIYCLGELPLTEFERFPDNPIEKIFWGRVPIQAASAYLYFTADSLIQKLTHQLKYKEKKEIGLYFGNRIGKSLKTTGRFESCDLIVPIPLHIKREKKRGYNQAAIIATGISEILNIPVRENIVVRIKATGTQTRKNRIQRWKNIEEKFQIPNTQIIFGKHILLVDDVITTGATMEACAMVLNAIPGVHISIICLAQSVPA